MEKKSLMNSPLRKIFTIVITILLVAYIAAMTMPFLRYDDVVREDGSNSITLMQYLWNTYNYPDLTRDVLPKTFTQVFSGKYSSTASIAIPLFSFVGALISIAIILILRKRIASIFFPIVWSFVSLLGYFLAPFMTLGLSSARTVHIIIFVITLVLSALAFFLIYLPEIRYINSTKVKI